MKVPFPTAIVGTVALSGVVQTVAQIIRATVVAEAVTPIATGANGEVTFSVEEVAYYVSAKKLSGESTIGTNAAGFTVVQPAEYEDVSIPYSTYYATFAEYVSMVSTRTLVEHTSSSQREDSSTFSAATSHTATVMATGGKAGDSSTTSTIVPGSTGVSANSAGGSGTISTTGPSSTGVSTDSSESASTSASSSTSLEASSVSSVGSSTMPASSSASSANSSTATTNASMGTSEFFLHSRATWVLISVGILSAWTLLL